MIGNRKIHLFHILLSEIVCKPCFSQAWTNISNASLVCLSSHLLIRHFRVIPQSPSAHTQSLTGRLMIHVLGLITLSCSPVSFLALLVHNHRPSSLQEESNSLPIFVLFCFLLLGGPPPPPASQSASVNIPGNLPSSTPYTMPPEPTLSQNPLSIMMSRMSKFAMPSSTPLYHDAIKTVASSDDDSPPARSPNLPSMNNMPGKKSRRQAMERVVDKRNFLHVFSMTVGLS